MFNHNFITNQLNVILLSGDVYQTINHLVSLKPFLTIGSELTFRSASFKWTEPSLGLHFFFFNKPLHMTQYERKDLLLLKWNFNSVFWDYTRLPLWLAVANLLVILTRNALPLTFLLKIASVFLTDINHWKHEQMFEYAKCVISTRSSLEQNTWPKYSIRYGNIISFWKP